jgi:Essential protein Yae1, N terminal
MADEDIFDAALNIEDTSYADGYAQGVSDGSHAGRVEGRIFGLEKGFEKFLEMGRLHGQARIWDARLPAATGSNSSETGNDQSTSEANAEETKSGLIPLPANPRLEKHIQSLLQLTDRSELSTTNDEDSVEDFDDRVKRARSKVKVIERLVGEQHSQSTTADSNSDSRAAQKGVRVTRGAQQQAPGAERNIEDFGLKSKS